MILRSFGRGPQTVVMRAPAIAAEARPVGCSGPAEEGRLRRTLVGSISRQGLGEAGPESNSGVDIAESSVGPHRRRRRRRPRESRR